MNAKENEMLQNEQINGSIEDVKERIRDLSQIIYRRNNNYKDMADIAVRLSYLVISMEVQKGKEKTIPFQIAIENLLNEYIKLTS